MSFNSFCFDQRLEDATRHYVTLLWSSPSRSRECNKYVPPLRKPVKELFQRAPWLWFYLTSIINLVWPGPGAPKDIHPLKLSNQHTQNQVMNGFLYLLVLPNTSCLERSPPPEYTRSPHDQLLAEDLLVFLNVHLWTECTTRVLIDRTIDPRHLIGRTFPRQRTHSQLDVFTLLDLKSDPYRNPNMNNKDHRVG